MTNPIAPHKLNRRERKAQALLAHYATCERLAVYLGASPEKVNGKEASALLSKLERRGQYRALCLCNDSSYTEGNSRRCKESIFREIETLFGKLPSGFFVNSDPRGYALKIDNENPEGKALIEACQLHTDWGGYGILSPEITGN